MNEPFNEKNDSFASLQARREKATFPNYLKQGQTFEDQVVEEMTRVDATRKDETPHESLPFDEQPDAALLQPIDKEEHQLPSQFRSFKEKATEGHQKYKPRVDWTSYLNTNQRKPFKPSSVPSSTRGLEKEVEQKVSYRELEKELLPNSTDLILFAKEEALLVSVDEQEDTIEKRLKEYNGTLHEVPVQSQVFTTKGYIPAFKRKQDSEVEAVQESLLEGLPETKVERRKAPEKPLTGKQRRAMKKSLSMIMEQEQQDRQLPYVHPKTQ